MARSIGDLLFQTKFKDTYQKAVLGILLANNQIEEAHLNFFKPHGITGQQFNVLRILRGQFPNPCTVQLIQERMIDKRSDVSRLVERLRVAGLAERHICPNNRRAVDVTISEEGLELLKNIDEVFNEFNPLSELSEAEAEEMIRILEKILK